MDTIYSRIIWGELKLDVKEYKIHQEDWKNTEKLIIDWIKANSLEKVNEVLFDISWIDRIVNDGWYDGPFYGLNQREKEKQYKVNNKPQSDIVIHGCGILPSMLDLAIKSRTSADEFRFMADILEAYYEKLPKKDPSDSSCYIFRIDGEGEEL